MINPMENQKIITLIHQKKRHKVLILLNILKQQMLVMDSLEKSRDPEYQNKLAAEEKLKANKEKMEEFLNSTFNVSKSGINNDFNAFTRKKKTALSKR
jgi:hypothetical protein